MCIKGARVILRDLKTEPSLLVLVLILFAVALGLQYKGGSEPLMLLIAAIVTGYSGRVKKTKEGQEQFERRIKRIQTDTYVWLGIAVAVSNLNLPFNQYSSYGIAIAAVIAFIHRVANAEENLSQLAQHDLTSERNPNEADSSAHTAQCRMMEEHDQRIHEYATRAAPLHYGLPRNETNCNCPCHAAHSYRVPQL